MLQFNCPNCHAIVDETELTPGGQAHLKRQGPGSSDEDFTAYLFMRKNPIGVHFERWLHSYGCGKWFHAARCTKSLEVFGTYDASCEVPPKTLVKLIKKLRPSWTGDWK